MTTYNFSVLMICTLAFGSIIGAYFTTAEYRIRFHKPLITKDCYCPECGHILGGILQIPVISWILLRGKCHYCGTPISPRYPLIELGFTAFYGITFLLLSGYPFLLCILWFCMVTGLLIFRCRSNPAGTVKGIMIFAGYHFFYGTFFLVIYSALGIL